MSTERPKTPEIFVADQYRSTKRHENTAVQDPPSTAPLETIDGRTQFSLNRGFGGGGEFTALEGIHKTRDIQYCKKRVCS